VGINVALMTTVVTLIITVVFDVTLRPKI
jgi:hypothetical protein